MEEQPVEPPKAPSDSEILNQGKKYLTPYGKTKPVKRGYPKIHKKTMDKLKVGLNLPNASPEKRKKIMEFIQKIQTGEIPGKPGNRSDACDHLLNLLDEWENTKPR